MPDQRWNLKALNLMGFQNTPMRSIIFLFFFSFSKWLFSYTLSSMTIRAENIHYFFSVMTNFFNHLLQWRNLDEKNGINHILCTICTSRSYVQNQTAGWLLRRRSFCSQHASPTVTCTHIPPLLRGTILLPLLL